MSQLLPSASVAVLIAVIEFIGSLLLIGYVVAALVALLRRQGIERVRLLVADGALWALDFKVAATLLKTMTLTTWQALAFFVVIFALRTLLKRAFKWERAQIERSGRRA